MKTSLFLSMISLSLMAGPGAATQDQAELLFDNALTFMNAGRYNEAITDFENIIRSHGDTTWAPMALLQMGNYYLDVAADHQKAETYYDRIQNDYATSPEAPAAYYYKALIAEQQGQSPAQLEAAIADLVRMANLFPGNQWQSGATYLFGKLSLRLKNYSHSLSHFQRLEFTFPNSPFLPDALLLSARAAWLLGKPDQALLILARLQTRFPNTPQSELAAAHLRLLDRFRGGTPSFQQDSSFSGASPKRFSNPNAVLVSDTDLVAIKGGKTAHFLPLARPGDRVDRPMADLVNFGRDKHGRLMLVYKDKVLGYQSEVSFKVLSAAGDSLDQLKGASMDEFGRLLVVDSGAKDLFCFSPSGQLIKAFNINKARLVRCYGSDILALASDESTLKKYNANLEADGLGPTGLDDIVDFCFDAYGNIYVLHDKGYQVSLFSHDGRLVFQFGLKSGSFSLKQGYSIAVDTSGAIYLADRRNGSVQRFH